RGGRRRPGGAGEPLGEEASLAEIEVWGTGAGSAPRDVDAWAAASAGKSGFLYDNAFVAPAAGGDATLQPGACASLLFGFPVARQAIHRACIAYEPAGVQPSAALGRSLNGAVPVGGLWLGGGSVHRTVTDEIDPRSLNGSDSAQLCLPDVASQPIAISAPRLLLELDDGTNLLDRDTQARLAEAFDRRPDTAAPLPQDPPSLAFDRPSPIDPSYRNQVERPRAA